MRTAPLIFSFSTVARSTSGRRSASVSSARWASSSPFRVQELVGDLLEALEAEVEPADHQQRRHRPRRDRADGERGRDEDQLVDEGALEDRPDDRQLALRPDAGHLLGVEREVVPEDAGRLLRGDLARGRPRRPRPPWPSSRRPWSGSRRRRGRSRCRRAGRGGWKRAWTRMLAAAPRSSGPATGPRRAGRGGRPSEQLEVQADRRRPEVAGVVGHGLSEGLVDAVRVEEDVADVAVQGDPSC